jgi:hypothetical protein
MHAIPPKNARKTPRISWNGIPDNAPIVVMFGELVCTTYTDAELLAIYEVDPMPCGRHESGKIVHPR